MYAHERDSGPSRRRHPIAATSSRKKQGSPLRSEKWFDRRQGGREKLVVDAQVLRLESWP